MKKTLALILLLFTCVFSLFSFSIDLALNSGYSYEYTDAVDYKWSEHSMPFGFELSFYFLDNFGFSAGFDFATVPFHGTFFEREVDISELSASAYFFPFLSLSYKYDFNDDVSLTVDLGARMESRWLYRNISEEEKITIVDVYASSGVRFLFLDSIVLKTGVECYVPVYSYLETSESSFSSYIAGVDVRGYIAFGYSYGY